MAPRFALSRSLKPTGRCSEVNASGAPPHGNSARIDTVDGNSLLLYELRVLPSLCGKGRVPLESTRTLIFGDVALRKRNAPSLRSSVLTASIGIARSGGGHERPESILRDADRDTYRAKPHGGGKRVVFSASPGATEAAGGPQTEIEDDRLGACWVEGVSISRTVTTDSIEQTGPTNWPRVPRRPQCPQIM